MSHPDTPDEITHDELKYKMLSRSRRRPFPEMRFMYFKVIKDVYNPTLSSIGLSFDRDHSSVIHGINCIEDWLETEPKTNNRYQSIVASFNRNDIENRLD